MSTDEAIAATVRAVIREEVPRAIQEALAKSNPTQHGDYLSPKEAAKVASCHVDTIRGWLKSGALQKHYAGHRLRVLRSDLERLLASGPPDNDGGPSAEKIAAAALAKRKGKHA